MVVSVFVLATEGRACDIDNHAVVNESPNGPYSMNCINNHSTANINGSSDVTIREIIDNHSGGNISSKGFINIGDRIDGESGTNPALVLDAEKGIVIGKRVDGGSRVTLRSRGPIRIGEKIDNGNTEVTWCAPSFTVPQVNGGAKAKKEPGCKFPNP
jgi:hypothetical protein